MHENLIYRCITLASKAYGQTSPNPLVGALIVRNGRVVAEGFHKGAGHPHAEAEAIKRAGKKCRGATLYLNLEPCCHFGRTPPCTDLIIKSGIKQVVYGMKDPNQLVNGRGLKALRKAGIKVTGPVLEGACRRLNAPFVKWMTTGSPFITAKIAITLDGRIADKKGDSKWISNKESRDYAHLLRAGADIVMVGAATARKDRPRLSVRLKGYKGRQPLKMVLKAAGGRVDLKTLFRKLGSIGFQSVLVEGGGRLHSELVKRGLIDRFVIFIAPKLLGDSAVPWIRDIGVNGIKNALQINITGTFLLGDNIVLEGYPNS